MLGNVTVSTATTFGRAPVLVHADVAGMARAAATQVLSGARFEALATPISKGVHLDGDAALVPATNLCRLSRGAMHGVDHNKDLTWVGSSIGLWEAART